MRLLLFSFVLLFLSESYGRRLVVNHQSYRFEGIDLGSRPWTPPDYSNQKDALGYNENTFDVPPGLEESYRFWLDIYAKYTTHEGLLHDSEYPHIIYDKVTFEDIVSRDDINESQKRNLKKQLVKSMKKNIKDRLLKLQKLNTADGLEGEDLRYWKMFKRVDQAQKFYKASKKGRLRFQLGQKDRFLQGIYYSGRYIERMEVMFKEMGLPLELTRIPFVESSFNLAARSKVGASGIWQFMRATGRQYMKVNYKVDERNDPIISTGAAGKLFRFNHKLLGNWPLAVTAYNYGPSGLRRLVRKYKTDNLVEIINTNRTSRFGFASANFYSSFLAALHVEKNAANYFKEPKRALAFEYDQVLAKKPFPFKTLVQLFDGNTELASLYNPHFGRKVRDGSFWVPRKSKVRVYKGKGDSLLALIDSTKGEPKLSDSKYRVARGETLIHIAKQFGVSVGSIMEMNNISHPRRLRAGQILLIPKSSR